MSARKPKLVLSPNARQDLSDVLVYTEQQWGKSQRAVYKAAFTHGLGELRRYPDLGRPRDDLRPGLRSYLIRQHVVYYRVEPDAIRVDRILHAAMDATRRLDE